MSPGLTPNAAYQASMLRIGPIDRAPPAGECGSVSDLLAQRVVADQLARHTCAQPRKTRWSPVRPSITGAGLPFSDSW